MTETGVRLVVDASALGAVFFRETDAERLEKKFLGRSLIAPTLIDYEVGSIYLKKLKTYPKLRQQLQECYRLFSRLALQRIDMEIAPLIALAEQEGLSIYDASYLGLATMMDAELLTLDKKLEKAWSRRVR